MWDCYCNCIVLYSSSMVPSLHLGEINDGIQMYQFTFEPLHFCFWLWLWFQIWTKLLVYQRICTKQSQISGFAYPYSTPSVNNKVPITYSFWFIQLKTYQTSFFCVKQVPVLLIGFLVTEIIQKSQILHSPQNCTNCNKNEFD